jgi:hypothetical protein
MCVRVCEEWCVFSERFFLCVCESSFSFFFYILERPSGWVDSFGGT